MPGWLDDPTSLLVYTSALQSFKPGCTLEQRFFFGFWLFFSEGKGEGKKKSVTKLKENPKSLTKVDQCSRITTNDECTVGIRNAGCGGGGSIGKPLLL